MPEPKTILLAGANRGLGLGLAGEFLARGWAVIATARVPDDATKLQALQTANPGRLGIKKLDIADPDSIKALKLALHGVTLDTLFVVAGISTQKATPITDLSAAQIGHEFVTNATSPIVLAETLLDQVREGGSIAFMTSILGSIASNAGGGLDLYRASKSALNMLAVNFAKRHGERPVFLLHPGWVRTDMGGKEATLDVATSVKGMADILERPAKPGIEYVDYQGQLLPW